MKRVTALVIIGKNYQKTIFYRAYNMDKEDEYYVSYVIMKVWKLLILKPNQAEAKPRKPKTIL